jgi:hypothetical protein
MSNDQKQIPVNLYGILDNEMARMHGLMQTYLSLPKDPPQYGQHTNGGLSSLNSFSAGPHNQIPVIYKRILDMQDLLLKAIESHDVVVQDKVAELALMGKSND